jgi:hypothetical protein
VPSSYSETAPDTYLSHPATAGPWGPDSPHGEPPAALLTRAVETLPRGERVIGRFTMELLGPVLVAELRVEASVVRPGRSVELCAATLYDARRNRPCARALAWLFPATEDGPDQEDRPLPHRPENGSS